MQALTFAVTVFDDRDQALPLTVDVVVSESISFDWLDEYWQRTTVEIESVYDSRGQEILLQPAWENHFQQLALSAYFQHKAYSAEVLACQKEDML